MTNNSDIVIISDFSSFNFDLLEFSPPKKFNGGQSVWITYNGQKLMIKPPSGMHCPFGLNIYTSGFNGVDKLSISLSFRGHEEDPQKAEFLEFLKRFDTHIKSIPLTNPLWFNGNLKSSDVLEETYNKLVKIDQNGRYAPTLKANFGVGGQNESSLYDPTGKTKIPINSENIPKGCTCNTLLSFNSVWFMGNKFGVAPRVQQIRCLYNESSAEDADTILGAGCAFIDDESD